MSDHAINRTDSSNVHIQNMTVSTPPSPTRLKSEPPAEPAQEKDINLAASALVGSNDLKGFKLTTDILDPSKDTATGFRVGPSFSLYALNTKNTSTDSWTRREIIREDEGEYEVDVDVTWSQQVEKRFHGVGVGPVFEHRTQIGENTQLNLALRPNILLGVLETETRGFGTEEDFRGVRQLPSVRDSDSAFAVGGDVSISAGIQWNNFEVGVGAGVVHIDDLTSAYGMVELAYKF